ncbi:unnamed protein product, partial [Rotaria magnacalcarata]
MQNTYNLPAIAITHHMETHGGDGDAANQLSNLSGLAFDSESNLYVVDT